MANFASNAQLIDLQMILLFVSN